METQPESPLPNNTDPIKAPSRDEEARDRRTGGEQSREGVKPGEKSAPEWNEKDQTKKGIGGAGSAADQPIH